MCCHVSEQQKDGAFSVRLGHIQGSLVWIHEEAHALKEEYQWIPSSRHGTARCVAASQMA